MTQPDKKQTTRRFSKGVRRRQLIEATIDSIARRGLGDTTLSHVSKTAGLSQGIVNLHFKSKDTLLVETLAFIRDDYEANWRDALSRAHPSPAARLAALLRSDYGKASADPKKLAVWFAFWGEVKSRPVYKKISRDRVAAYTDMLTKLLAEVIDEGGYTGHCVDDLAESITAMADGLWLNMLLHGKAFDRKHAQQVMMKYLARTFPSHADYFL